ncbi:MAG: helix-turn-helix domain-containing protein [Syntrophorhabdales bacterium]
MNKVLTVKDVAGLIQAKPSTIYSWAEQGLIPHFKINGLLRFGESEITAWLETHRRPGACYTTDARVKAPKKGGN